MLKTEEKAVFSANWSQSVRIERLICDIFLKF